MSSTLSEDGPVVAQPMTRGRHAAVRPKRRLRALGSIARSIQVPVPAPVSRRSEERRDGPAPDRPTAPAATPAATADTLEVAVLAGETVSDVAARHGVSTASLIALNGLSWRTGVLQGDVLLVRAAPKPAAQPLPAVRSHEVRPGETAAAIAARYGVGVAALLLANGLSQGRGADARHRARAARRACGARPATRSRSPATCSRTPRRSPRSPACSTRRTTPS